MRIQYVSSIIIATMFCTGFCSPDCFGDALGSDCGLFTKVGNYAYFVANDGLHGRELWRTDGTEEGTTLVVDLTVGPEDTQFRAIAGSGDFVYSWAAPEGQVPQLWCTSIASGETEALFQPDFSGTDPWDAGMLSADYWPLFGSGGTIFFVAEDAEARIQVWKSDGTPAGTVKVSELVNYGASVWTNRLNPINAVEMDGFWYFSVRDINMGSSVWRTDGTEAGTTVVHADFAKDLAVSGHTLYIAESLTVLASDGTEAGTRMLKKATESEFPVFDHTTYFVDSVDGFLYFTFDDVDYCRLELWKTNGTPSGTTRVRTLISYGRYDNRPYNYLNGHAVAGGKLFLAVGEMGNDESLWSSDGTEGGTNTLGDFGYPNPRIFYDSLVS